MNHLRLCGTESGSYWDRALHLLGFCVLALAVLTETGCVSQRAYERVKAETDEMSRSLSTAREEVALLHQSISSLETANREEEHAAEELRAAVQREVELLPVLRQQAHERMALLQMQIATLAGQSRMLAKQVAVARRESNSLKVLVAQYKREMEEARAQPETPLSSGTSEAPPVIASMDDASSSLESVPPPVTIPQQVAQAASIAPVKEAPPPAPPRTPAQTGPESWIDVIMNWLSSVWNWILGLFG
ncbi:MAG: hypothetical protein NNA21_09760 [Nitrospira sp.]|nr:hypothetical protein [Nitrospira sp.]MCP9462235.1 hypothetical protein [Nitrospira sp.]MCP9474738.1 hypothetical protein [Nitrospira sp.]